MRSSAVAMGLAILTLAWAPGLQAGDMRPTPESIDTLVRQLGAENFATRERASRELSALGVAGREALERATHDSDAEVRSRARTLLAAITETDFQRQLEAFAADFDGSQKQTLPGWEQFSARFGTSRVARQLFVEMQRSESELLESLARGDKATSEALERRTSALVQQLMQSQREGMISLGTMATLLFVGSLEGVAAEEAMSLHLVPWMFYQSTFQKNVHNGAWSLMLKKLMGMWVVKDANPAATYQNLVLAASLDLKSDVLTVSRRVVADQGVNANTRQVAVLMIGRFNDKEQIPTLEKLLADTTSCGMVQANNPPRAVEVQIRDVALAVLVHLTGQNVKQYGFHSIQPYATTLFQVGTLGFSGPTGRETALKKWREWRAAHPNT